MAQFIHDNFIPVEGHIKEHPAWFKRFDAVWTPTLLVMDPGGRERWRIEGYVPKKELRAQLEMALARLAVVRKDWSDAGKRYGDIAEKYGDTSIGPEALYWRNVSRYSQNHDATALQSVSHELKERYPNSIWARKASVWA